MCKPLFQFHLLQEIQTVFHNHDRLSHKLCKNHFLNRVRILERKGVLCHYYLIPKNRKRNITLIKDRGSFSLFVQQAEFKFNVLNFFLDNIIFAIGRYFPVFITSCHHYYQVQPTYEKQKSRHICTRISSIVTGFTRE
jgi:hypothetical protein